MKKLNLKENDDAVNYVYDNIDHLITNKGMNEETAKRLFITQVKNGKHIKKSGHAKNLLLATAKQYCDLTPNM